MLYTITKNDRFNSLEITFDGKPCAAIRDALKKLRFRWHSVRNLWYGFATAEAVEIAIREAENGTTQSEEKRTEEPKTNKYGVCVGDIFSASWGWEQTNVDFFQVVELVGQCSVRVREVYLPMVGEKGVSGMSADRTYNVVRSILPPCSSSVFIKDQERGDLKRLKPGYHADPAEAAKNCSFTLSSFADAHKVNSDTITTYESWYA